MTDAPRILFLADAGAQVGGGHVMRCLTLAEALGRAGAACAFVTPPAVGAVLDAFAPGDIERWPASTDGLGDIIEAARAWAGDVVVLDHYRAGLAEERALRDAIGKLVVLDDLKRDHRCDLAVDSNLGRVAADYAGAEALTGPDVALVRPAFARLRAASLARRRRPAPVKRILVALGLTDVGGATARVTRALEPLLGERRLDIVVGAGAASLPMLRAMAAQDRRLTLHVDTQEMAALTAAADLAVGAGGSSVWERGCLGLPSLTLVLAANQRENTRALAARGATVMIDALSKTFDARLAEAGRRLIDDDAARRDIGLASAALCDGLGADRVAARVMALSLSTGQ